MSEIPEELMYTENDEWKQMWIKVAEEKSPQEKLAAKIKRRREVTTPEELAKKIQEKREKLFNP